MATASHSKVTIPETDDLVLPDGTVLRVRAIGADDRHALVAFFSRLSPESRRRRFHGPGAVPHDDRVELSSGKRHVYVPHSICITHTP